MRVIDQINNLESCIYDARQAQGDLVYYVCYPSEYDGLDAFIDDCQKEITRLEKLELLSNFEEEPPCFVMSRTARI